MPRYRRRPPEVNAVRFDPDSRDVPKGVTDLGDGRYGLPVAGGLSHPVRPGEYLILDGRGRAVDVMGPDCFESMYEPVGEADRVERR